MANIIYGVCGEGMGHAMRSMPILEHLKKKHNIRIFASSRAYHHLKKRFEDITEITGLNIIYKKDSVDAIGTVVFNVSNFFRLLKSLKMMLNIINESGPDIIISDYEIISAYAALIKGVPLVSIDNQHVTGMVKINFPKKYWPYYIETRLINRMNIIRADHYFVTSFFYPQIKSKKTSLVPPILKNNIYRMTPKHGNHILVYQTSDTNKELIKILRKIDGNFIVYGLGLEKRIGNVMLKRFDESMFLKDISNCRALITNGGFTLITEALHLGKPVLSIPVRKQFEQIVNAIYIDRLGFGRHIDYATEKGINDFISNLNAYKANLKKYKKKNNSEILRRLDRIIDELTSHSC